MVLSNLSDMELVNEVRKRNMEAFRTLYYRHVSSVFSLVSRLLGNRRSDVDDMVQEIFLHVHRSIHGFQGTASFSTWLHRVVVNVCCTHLRKKSTVGEIPNDTEAKESVSRDGRESWVDARRKVRKLYTLLDEMRLENRTVFTLYELQGYTLSEIADMLDLPLHTVASRLRRSREYLGKAIVITDRRAEGGLK